MNNCYLQRWEESERGWGVRPDGASLHLREDNHKKYLKDIYDNRMSEDSVPHEYDRIVGPLIPILISDNLFEELLKNNGDMRIYEHQLNNLIKLDDIKLGCLDESELF